MSIVARKKATAADKKGAARRRPPARPRGAMQHVKEQPNLFLALTDDLRAIGMKVPAEEWRKLPEDFNENLDHYLYGSPKKLTRDRRARPRPVDAG